MSAGRSHASRGALDADYEILRELGVGGTAIVYLARKRRTGEEVAIKLIRATFLEDEEALARFAREARYASRLDHPNIVPIREVVLLNGGGIALVMAHVPGQTLKDYVLEHGRLPVARAEDILRDVAAGLNAAHALDIVHRDVKPENIFLDYSGNALLADFGLARSSTSTDTQLTMTGVAIGTPAYMPPEQLDGAVVDARGDIYSLGLVCWQMLTGKRPWDGEGLYALLYHQKHDYLPDVREFRSDVPDRLADVIATAIQKDPERRWQNVGEMIAALDGAIPARRQGFPETPVTSDTLRISRLEPKAEQSAAPTAGASSITPALSGPEPAYIAALSELSTELEQIDAESTARGRRTVAAVAGVVGIAALVMVAIAALIVTRHPSSVASDITLAGRVASSTSAARADSSAIDTTSRVDTSNTTLVPSDTASRTAAINRLPLDSGAVTLGAPPAAVPKRPAPSAISPPAPSRPSATIPLTSSNAEVTPARATLPSTAAARAIVVAGGMHTCLIGADGHGYCLGSNSNGQLGEGGASGSDTRASTLAPIGGNLELLSLAAGLSHSCGIAQDGFAWCWGDNDHGQLGDRSMNAHGSPVRVADSHFFRSIAAGAAHTCALDGDGYAWCWGAGSRGQLGNDSTNDATAPVSQRREHFTMLVAGWNHTCALDGFGKAYCWGDNSSGQLGTGDSLNRVVPTPVATALSFTSIAAGASHTCAVTAQGLAYCWGKNSNGQLGDGTAESRSTPVLVKSESRFTSATSGAMHSCAIDKDGQALCWGLGAYGQLGDGSARSASEPVLVAGGHRFSMLRAFGSHTCGSTPTGEAFCWGYNLEGQLGDGTRTNRSRPVYLEPPSGK